MTDKIIISLFDYSGTWSLPYRLAGYRVLQIDSKLGVNIYDFNFKSLPRTIVHGILTAPPCTDFSKAGANLWVAKDLNGTTKKSLKLIYRTFDIIDYFNPTWWVLEQPPGRLETLIPSLKNSRLMSFHPYQFGDPYKKYTILYGRFNPFFVQFPVTPIFKTAHGQMSIDNYQIHHQKKT
ncbi:unnamed protein product, partial [marine sediment metagenome]